ncbi:MotA/TolQ/ExbB proton channel family protein [Virgibacillus halophilus]|uniref:MotA/TolQ/ExbB proton channel family protein n=1 Tax=Tigheibacillus halophilus TaxID=361280 RepID=UPI003626E416
MRKRDLLTPAGITLGFVMIMLAIIAQDSDHAASFLDISSIFIVIGGVVASLLINFKREELHSLLPVLKETLKKQDQSLTEVLQLFVKLSERARREGLLALEKDLDEVEDPFIRKGVSLVVDGMEAEMITEIMNAEITALEERHYRGRMMIEKCGEYAPAWGMIGTLVGLVLMLTTLENPATLGPSMAVALLTTLYGTVLAHLVFLPMAGKLENKTEAEIFTKQIILEGVISIQSGQNPRIVEEKLSAFLPNGKYTGRVRSMEDKVHGA